MQCELIGAFASANHAATSSEDGRPAGYPNARTSFRVLPRRCVLSCAADYDFVHKQHLGLLGRRRCDDVASVAFRDAFSCESVTREVPELRNQSSKEGCSVLVTLS